MTDAFGDLLTYAWITVMGLATFAIFYVIYLAVRYPAWRIKAAIIVALWLAFGGVFIVLAAWNAIKNVVRGI